MNFPGGDSISSSGGGGGNTPTPTPSPRKELQLQGPRPAALKVNKESHKIRKPPIAPQSQQEKHPPAASVEEDEQQRQPVIIYAVSPKVIHTTVTDFMNLVQRLTGNTTGDGDLSPAARLASIETSTSTSPSSSSSSRDKSQIIIPQNNNNNIMSDFLHDFEVGGSRGSGILSPAPSSLPPISPGFFSPAPPHGYNNYYNMFLPSSPSTLFSAPLVSPSPSSSSSFNIINNNNLFNPFFDF